MKKIIIASILLIGLSIGLNTSTTKPSNGKVASPIAPTPTCGMTPQGCPPPPSQG